jgi:hypothetical protein
MTVAALTADGCATSHPNLPTGLEVPDTRGLLEPLSARRREWLETHVEERSHLFRRDIEKEVLACGRHHEDVLLLFHCLGNWRACAPIDWYTREHDRFVEAAQYEVMPYKVMVLFRPDAEEGCYSVGWLDPEQVGFHGEDKARFLCRGHWSRYPRAWK